MKTRLSVGVAIGTLVAASCADENGSDDASTTPPTSQATVAADSVESTRTPTTSAPPSATTGGSATSTTVATAYDLNAAASCVIRTAVELGSNGDDVRCLQTRLQEVTVSGEDVAVDGDFGPMTDRAVRQFQEAHNLMVDGVVGAQTAEMLGVWSSPDSQAPPSLIDEMGGQ